MATILAKVNVTSDFKNWWQIDLSSLIMGIEHIKIISAVLEHGNFYLIYSYEIEDEETTEEQ